MKRALLIGFLILMLGAVVIWLGRRGAERLSVEQAEMFAEREWNSAMSQLMDNYLPMWSDRCLKYGNYAMPFDVQIFGQEPANGRSLYISMHGGGNVPANVNDQQWENQKHLYKPKEGVYIAPRAAVDDWNMWFRPHIDTLFEMLIQCAVSQLNVNPNRVYLMGYSAGGDGTYRMAPRLADHWAAASMMAGHVGEASPLNLRNIGYMVWMGEHDSAYNRNRLAVEYGKLMDSLQLADSNGYAHKTTIVEGCGHWMNRADTAAIDWLCQFERNPYPERIVWRQEDSNLRDWFYYLSIPEHEMAKGKELRVEYNGNTINIVKCDYGCFTIHLNDKMMNLSNPVIVKYNGNIIHDGMVYRSEANIEQSIAKRMDKNYIFPAKIHIDLKE